MKKQTGLSVCGVDFRLTGLYCQHMTTKKNSAKSGTGVRERLINSADQLFYQEGFRAVGIDRVLADAGVAKASMYTHFRSKDELMAACIQRRTLDARAQIEAQVGSLPPAERALGLFDFLLNWVSQPDFRGCPVQHLVSEYPDAAHPARTVAREQRQWLQQQLVAWCADAGASEPQRTADALLVLFDGATAGSEQDGIQRAQDARWAAKRLLSRAE